MIASILSPYLTSLKIPTTAHKRKLSVMAASLPFWELSDPGASQPQAAGGNFCHQAWGVEKLFGRSCPENSTR